MALYHDMRPTSFDTFTGNEAAIKSLVSLHKEGKLPHVILLTGPSGTGKTTVARILANMLDIENVKEYNSSNTRGIDTAREIIEEMRYPIPTVYILDEFHKATADMNNAMLKPFEDYPDYIYFFICTTEPNKILTAVKTRCHEVALRGLTEDEIFTILRSTCKAKGRKVPPAVLEAITEKSDGSARKALVDLEKVLYIEGDESELLAALNTNDSESKEVIDLCRALLDGDWKKVSSTIQGINTTDWESIRYAVLGYMTSVLLKSGQRKAAVAIEFFKEPWYNSGKSGLAYAAFMSVNMK